jgi:carbon storage regulator
MPEISETFTEGKSTMLIMSRKEHEAVVIGGNIRITVLAARKGQTRLGIEAPPGVKIKREELTERIIETLTEPFQA